MFCPKCGKEVNDDAEICVNCGTRVKCSDFEKKFARFLLTFFLGFIGSIIINHTSLKPNGWKSRSYAYFFLGIVTLGIYALVACVFNLVFNENQESNIGYFKD